MIFRLRVVGRRKETLHQIREIAQRLSPPAKPGSESSRRTRSAQCLISPTESQFSGRPDSVFAPCGVPGERQASTRLELLRPPLSCQHSPRLYEYTIKDRSTTSDQAGSKSLSNSQPMFVYWSFGFIFPTRVTQNFCTACGIAADVARIWISIWSTPNGTCSLNQTLRV